MIFVITGTERFPMNRLIQKVDRLSKSETSSGNVFIQLGSCTYEPEYCEWTRFLSFGQMCQKIEEADTIIAHAGAGTTLLCIQMGHHPILVPRMKKYGEHIDDHQISFCKKFATTGRVHILYDLEKLVEIFHLKTKIGSFLLSENESRLVQQLDKMWGIWFPSV